MTYDQIVQEIENLFEALQDIFIAALIRFGPYIVASIPAIFTGTSVAATHGGFIGSVVGIGLEVTVLLSVYAASSLYDQKLMSKFWFMVWLFPFYFIGIALAILYPTSTGLGLVAPILTIICYIAGMFIREVGKERKRQAVVEADKKQAEAELSKAEIEHKHELERLALELKHAEKMARIEASKNRPDEHPDKRSKSITKDEAVSLILQFLADNPDASLSQIGRQIGRPKSTTGNYVNELIQAGKVHKNGEGWKIIQP